MKWLAGLLLALALADAAALLQRGQPVGWDELEYFRATRWVAEGRVPFRDFWEHHTPLQWIVFAPVAMVANGPGTASIVLMRWAQAGMGIAALSLLLFIARCAGATRWSRWFAVLFLLTSPSFLRSAIEYRVDALGNFLFLAAIALAMMRPRWIAFGALMAAAVLANMRMAPLVVIAAVIVFIRDRRAWRMVFGVAAVAGAFTAWLFLSGARQPFLEGVIRYNRDSANLLQVHTFIVTILSPVWSGDVAAIALWIAAIAGAVLSWRDPKARELVLLFAASIATVAVMQVHYEYHFLATYLLMVPLAALAFDRLAAARAVWRYGLATIPAIALLVGLLQLVDPAFGNEMRYQDAVMREVDRRTLPSERVWDGSGYALRREPAYRYWFLATGVRMLAGTGKLPPYDITREPPAAIIYNLRLQRWFELFPETARYATHHYVPLYRDLWIPGMTAVVKPGSPVTWRAPRDGRYTAYASPVLLRHPWVTNPQQYASITGPLAARYAIPLRKLPVMPADALTLTVNSQPVAWTKAPLQLHKGDRVDVVSHAPAFFGFLLVPDDVAALCLGPEEEFLF